MNPHISQDCSDFEELRVAPSRNGWKDLFLFFVFPPLGAISVLIDTILGKEILEIDSVKKKEAISKPFQEYFTIQDMGDDDNEFLKKLKRGDYVRTLMNYSYPQTIWGIWGTIEDVRMDGFIDLKYTLSDVIIKDIVDNFKHINPHRIKPRTLKISAMQYNLVFKDIDEIVSRKQETKEFNFEHELIYSCAEKCTKCGTSEFTLDINQWSKGRKPNFKCLQCMPPKMYEAFFKAGTHEETIITEEHLIGIHDSINPNSVSDTGFNFRHRQREDELPQKEDFDIVDEFLDILDKNKEYKKK